MVFNVISQYLYNKNVFKSRYLICVKFYNLLQEKKIMTLKKLFGRQVKLLRKLNNMTQEKLSELAGIDIRHLARIEAGESFATSETIDNLCSALHVSYKEMFDFENSGIENNCENMTSDDIKTFKKNYGKLCRMMEKISKSSEKTEYIMLAFDALYKKSAREQLKSLLLGMMLK